MGKAEQGVSLHFDALDTMQSFYMQWKCF